MNETQKTNIKKKQKDLIVIKIKTMERPLQSVKKLQQLY